MTAKDKEKATTAGIGHDGRVGVPWRIGAWAAAVLFLLAIFVASQVNAAVNWTARDFVFAGGLLFGSLAVYEIVARTTHNIVYRAGAGVAIMGALLLTWGNAAVGITDSIADIAYLGVPVVGIVGAFLARFRPKGMARALFATAAAQAFVTAVALVSGRVPAYNSVYEILGINCIFVVLFVGSAVLFEMAARSERERGTA